MGVAVGVMAGFTVSIDGRAVEPSEWRRRDAVALVKILVLAPRARLHRDRVVDLLWPDLDQDAALPRLHKAAHFARQALGSADAVVLREQAVSLLPGREIDIDVVRFEAHVELLRDAVTAGDRAAALRRFDEMEHILGTELGVAPGPEATALRARIVARPPLQRAATAGPGWQAAARPTLLERGGDLAALSRTGRAVLGTGRGAVVTVMGEAGSGKSSLVQAFSNSVQGDFLIAVGGCDDLLAPVSLGPFRDMVHALPELEPVLAADDRPNDVFGTLLRCLALRPTLLVVEDVHWADDVTLDAIRFLSRRMSGVRSILMLTYRAEDVDVTHPLRRILGGLTGPALRRIELLPLSVLAVARLAGVPAAEAQEIHRVTRGNPFFVTEILQAPAGEMPATVRDAVLARVGRLPEVCRRFVQRLSVVPSRAERWLAEAIADGDPDVVSGAERSSVIGGGVQHVAFRHELARRAVETSLTAGEVVQANRVVLDVLLLHPDVEPSRIVHHAVRAARIETVLRYGPVAAAAAERAGAHRQAAETLRVVLRFADRVDPRDRAGLLTRRAYSLYVVNEYEAALPCAEAAVAGAEESQDMVLLADALVVLSRIALFARGPMTARRAAGRAVEVLEALQPAADDARLAVALTELARTHSNLVTPGIVAQPSIHALHHAARAVELCRRIDRDDLRAQALCYLGSARLALGDARGSDDLELALSLSAGDVRPETRVRSYVNAAGSAYRAGRLADAERYVAAGLRLAADTEFAAGEYRLRLTSAAVSSSAGDWDRAIAVLRELVASPGSPGVMALFARGMLARLLARRGEPECRRILLEAMGSPIAAADSFVAGPLAAAEIEIGWLTGTLVGPPTGVLGTLEMAAESGNTAAQGEIGVYLRRAGFDPGTVAGVPEPWASGLRGDAGAAAGGWERLGDRYEQAVELATAGDDESHDLGLRMLADLGADGTVARLRRPAG
ncbi:ATP-binding protein [Nakamurella sp. GG22]